MFKRIYDNLIAEYVKRTGKQPEGIDLLKLKLQAQEEARQAAKVVEFKPRSDSPYGKPGGWMPTKEEAEGIMSRLSSDIKNLQKQAQELKEMGGKGDTLDFMIDYFGLDPNIKKGKTKAGKINYEEMQKKFPSVELFGDESFDELLEIEKTGKHPREEKAVGGRIGYAYGRGLKLKSLFKKEGTTLEKAYKESMDDFIQYSGDPKYDADAILDDMLEKYGIDRDELDQYDVLDAYGKIYDDLQMNRRESMYERAAEQELEGLGTSVRTRKKEAKGGLSYIIGE